MRICRQTTWLMVEEVLTGQQEDDLTGADRTVYVGGRMYIYCGEEEHLVVAHVG